MTAFGLRIGHGYDVHRLLGSDRVDPQARSLVLGGVAVDSELRVVAHSDGDVLLHALIDALLGAAGLGDIGRLFPDSDAQWAGAPSTGLLAAAYQQVTAAGWSLVNADLTLVAQRPRIAAYVPQMRVVIAEVLEIDEGTISVKATTTEKLGFEGRGEGIAAHAVVLLHGPAHDGRKRE